MRLGLRIFLGYFLIVGLAAWLVLSVFVGEIKPGVRQAMEDTLVDTANVLAILAADDMQSGHMQDGQFARRVSALAKRDVHARIWGFRKESLDYRVYLTDAHGIVVFDSSGKDVGRDYSRWNDVYLTLHGRYGARSTPSIPGDENSTVMHVAAPIMAGARIIGVLTVAKPNRTIAPFIASSQLAIQRWGFLLLGVALAVGLLISLWFSRELTRLRRFAHAVTAGERVPPPRGSGEFGELGQALETMRERLDGKQYVEQYVHSLTHEMKSPLAAIRGAAELLQEPMPEPERQRFAANILDHSQRLARMIDMTLALAAVEHRQAIEQADLFDLAALVRDAASEFESQLAASGIALRINAPAASIHINGDRFLVGHAIRNLLQNAQEFSPRGGTIAVSLRIEGNDAHLAVRDQGPGVPEFALPKVFDRFYSLARPDGQRSSGLGLCFVREVASLHQGTAALSNDPAGGAIATLRLPL
ncbi:MAG TPA: two-component system sensor histidine kinase CreC [Xanthomonadaceae bacterium]|nr:two-component system sensor histidine kinase CreC [Xanthomonadaceae bacterium]